MKGNVPSREVKADQIYKEGKQNARKGIAVKKTVGVAKGGTENGKNNKGRSEEGRNHWVTIDSL